MIDLTRKIALLLVVAAAVWLTRSSSQPTDGEAPETTQPVPMAADVPFHGLAIQVDSGDDVVKRFAPLIAEVARLGADTVMFSTAGYQENAASGVIYVDQRKTPTSQQWAELFAVARRHRLRVIFMPILLLSEPRGNEWRGVIQPPSWDQWFDQYRRFLNHFIEIAARNRAEVFMIGSELVSTEKFTDQWLRTIAELRKNYDGVLGYSANWDHYRKIKFWDKIDLIGMTTYHKLAEKPGPTVQQLIEAWKPIRREILDWQATVARPILFTEVGWCSQEGCSVEPWNYYHKQVATPAGMEEQRACYEAFMRTWENVPAVGGTIWWEWTPYGGGPDCFNYTPRGKPAEKLLGQWFYVQRERWLQKELTDQNDN